MTKNELTMAQESLGMHSITFFKCNDVSFQERMGSLVFFVMALEHSREYNRSTFILMGDIDMAALRHFVGQNGGMHAIHGYLYPLRKFPCLILIRGVGTCGH